MLDLKGKTAFVTGGGSVGEGWGNGQGHRGAARAAGCQGVCPGREQGRGRGDPWPGRTGGWHDRDSYLRHDRVQGRCRGGCRLRAAIRRDRHPRQQRRRLGPGRPGRHERGGLGCAARPESEVGISGLQARHSGHARTGPGRDRQSVLGGRLSYERGSRACRVQHGQARHRRLLEIDRDYLCEEGRSVATRWFPA